MLFRRKKASDNPAPVASNADEAATQTPEKTGLFARLSRSRETISRGIGNLLGRQKTVDDSLLDELEDELIMADMGVEVATTVMTQLRRIVQQESIATSDALLTALKDQLVQILQASERPFELSGEHKPLVVLMVGVNGVGKTTTTAKLAAAAKKDGLSVLLAAGDTFRAAAIEQLQHWGERIDVPVVAQSHGSDAAAVAHDALQSAQSRQADLLLIDTAGRQHTHGDLMEQLSKVERVVKKLDSSAPHEILLTVDAATGQNALTQVEQFNAQVPLTGLVVTKLDGTAKGGIMIALAQRFALPIRFVGVGEGVADLRPFDAKAFVDALLPDDLL